MNELEAAYESKKPHAKIFAHRLKEQIEEILSREKIPLALPIEARVKEWESVKRKIDSKKLDLKSIEELDDLIGARIILHFKRDVEQTCNLIASTFKVLSSEDTQLRLGVSQFGYQSMHFQIALPESWLNIPTFKDYSAFSVEIQVRTAAQHIWASASHVLQYKQEESVPSPVLRSINRVSALLETVDLEFERVLQQRQEYRDELNVNDDDTSLNVESLKAFLDSIFPTHGSNAASNETPESYDEILQDLRKHSITKLGQLRKFTKQYKPEVIAWEKEVVRQLKVFGKLEDGRVSAILSDGRYDGDATRLERGVFCSHVGLIFQMLSRLHPE
jgi:putative GTP pyrophosphokinase